MSGLLRLAAAAGRESVRAERGGAGRLIEAAHRFSGVRPFAETFAFWARKNIVASDVFEALSDEIKAQSGRLVGVWHTTFTSAIYDSLGKAIERGSTLRDWLPEAQQILDGFGAAGGEAIYTGTEFSTWYADLVFRNAWASSYAAGRYSEMFSPEWIEAAPYWLYSAIHDDRTRDEHAKLDGKVFRKSDPSARRLLAPLGHNCRCTCIELNEDDLAAGGYTVTNGRAAGYEPEPGWGADKVAALVPDALKRAA